MARQQNCRRIVASLMMPLAVCAPVAWSQTCPVDNQAWLGGAALAGSRGLVSVNQAAGDGNQQANGSALAVSPGGRAIASQRTEMRSDAIGAAGSANAAIGDSAFRGLHGALGINQAAGSANQQANTRAFAVGRATEIDDAVLMQQTAGAQSSASTQSHSDSRLTTVAPGAFEGASGLVQMNQAAGNNNASANQFVATASFGGHGE